MGLRSSLYKVACLMGDANPAKKGKAGKRVAMRAAPVRLQGVARASYSSKVNPLPQILPA